MIHPDVRLKHINELMGYGIFATKLIPKGTIVYIRDPYERVFTRTEYDAIAEPYLSIVERYCYTTPEDKLILSWDLSKYVNHNCNSSSLMTGWGCSVAVRDIAEGEEITEDYGLFNIREVIDIYCACPNCRKQLKPNDIETLHAHFDARIEPALQLAKQVAQPLFPFMEEATRRSMQDYLDGKTPYRSVTHLKNKHA